MEQQFSVDYSLDKKLLHEFGYIHLKRSKSWAVILGCAIALMLLCIWGALFQGSVEVYMLLPTLFFYFFWLFADYYCSSFSYRNANKKMHGITSRLTFTEERLISESSLSNGSIAYTGFLDVFESDSLFVIYFSKASAILVPKSNFTEGTVDGFRAFIAQKIGPVLHIPRPTRRRILGIVLGVCFVLGMVGSLCLNRYWANRSVPFESGPYSICLPASFESNELEDYAFFASTDEVYVYTYTETKQELRSYGLYGLNTLEDYVDSYISDYEIKDYSCDTLENGAICLTYRMDFDDTPLYYCDTLMKSGDTFWVTEFYCLVSAQDKYAPLFHDWASSIQIAE